MSKKTARADGGAVPAQRKSGRRIAPKSCDEAVRLSELTDDPVLRKAFNRSAPRVGNEFAIPKSKDSPLIKTMSSTAILRVVVEWETLKIERQITETITSLNEDIKEAFIADLRPKIAYLL